MLKLEYFCAVFSISPAQIFLWKEEKGTVWTDPDNELHISNPFHLSVHLRPNIFLMKESFFFFFFAVQGLVRLYLCGNFAGVD